MGTIRSTNGPVVSMFARFNHGPMTRREAWSLIEPVRCALQRLLDGVGGREDVATVGIAFNMAYLRSDDLGNTEDQAWFDMAGLALGALDAQEPPRPPTPAEHETLCVAVNRYDSILRACSYAGWATLLERMLVIAGEKTAA